MLAISDLHVYYSNSILALDGIDLDIQEGGIACLLGSNGAGKTTLLRAIAGILFLYDAQITKGEISFRGVPITRRKPEYLVKQGICLVPQGRHIFREMTVMDNLLLGAYTASSRRRVREDVAFIFDMFPPLRKHASTAAGYLSGGEQQMLSIARGLMARPTLLLLDEPSLGLSPIVVRDIFNSIAKINQNLHCTILLSEQNASMALDISHRGYVLENGVIAMSGSREELLSETRIQRVYLGMGSEVNDHQ